jgi:hypothetical protein
MYDDLSTGVTPFRSDMGRELIASPLSINQTCGFIIPIDPVGPHCYQGGTKPC